MSGGVERVFQSIWSRGPQLITQAEYYLQTGDNSVLPSIRARAIEIANGQSMFGTMGHNFALQQPDGQNNGPYAIGYGPVNNAGMPCFLGLVLANKCGLTDAPILAGIDRAAKFFQYYTDLGGIHYGESAEHLNLMSNNGKSGLAAIALGMLNGYETQAKYFTKQSVYGAIERDKGHTGPFFSHLWTPLGANLGGQAALTRYFQQNAALYDLARRWNGAFVYQANGIEVYGTDHRASWTTLLTYAAPLAKLHITGKNGLACLTNMNTLPGTIVLKPLPGLPVIRDVIVDMTQFFKQYHSIKPYLINNNIPPETERLQSPEEREELNGLYECILCASCSTSCPSFWWNPDKFVGPAGLLQAYRFIADSRDEATAERLDNLEDPYRLFRCHTIMNCVDVCPKGLNPTKAIGKIKEMMVRRAV